MEDVMTKFKVGDRVRSGERDGTIVGDDNEAKWPLRVECDDHTTYWMERDGSNNSAWEEGMILITTATDELAELRAWKDAAIAKHPDLSEPETDEDAAMRLATEIKCGGPSVRLATEAIKWARANPR